MVKMAIPAIFFVLLSLLLSKIPTSEKLLISESQIYDMDQYEAYTYPEDMFGIITIPAISLNNPLYQINSFKNQVDQNIQLLKENIHEEKHLIVLAAHSGNGPHAYFRNLEKLHPGNQIIIRSHDLEYHYEYFKKEEVPKTGTVYLENYDFSYLALITCSKTKDDIQEIYYAKMLQN